MGRSKASPWIAGTVVLSLVILSLAWFLAISPSLDRAAQARADAEQAQAQNVIQAQRLATLKQQFAELDVYRAELAEIRTRIPAEVELPDLLRAFDAQAASAGVTVLSLVPGTPQDFFPAAAPVASEPVVEDGAEEAEGDADEAGPPVVPEPTGPVVLEGFVAMPLQVSVVGGYEAVAGFVADLQEGMERLYVVTSFESTRQDAAEASGARPATAEGDVEMVINGYVYVLKDLSAAPTGGSGAEEIVTS